MFEFFFNLVGIPNFDYVIFFFMTKAFLYLFCDNKLSTNFTSMTHAVTTVITSFFYLICNNPILSLPIYITNTKIIQFSISYFIYDFIMCLFNQRGIMLYAYLYHHIASILMLNQNDDYFPPILMIFLAELSNIPMYFVYFYLKRKKESPNNSLIISKLNYWKSIQKMGYLFIRIPIFGGIMLYYFKLNYDESQYDNLLKMMFMFPVYIMGLVWSCKLIEQ